MNDLKIFEKAEFGSVRVIMKDGEPWFVARDVAEALGSTWSGSRIAHVPDEWKGVTSVVTPGGTQEVATLSEPGVYFFLGRSDKPAALPYQKWIAGDVAPSIRRTGGYLIDKPDDTPEVIMARAVLVAQDTIKRLESRNTELEGAVSEMKPKALFADSVASSSSSILVGQLAALIRQNGVNIGQNRLFEWMRGRGYLVSSGSRRNFPTQKSLDMGLFEVKERAINNPDGSVRLTLTTKVTGKGQIYFVNKFMGGVSPEAMA